MRYRAEGINPANGLAFRRVENGRGFAVSGGEGFIAGEARAEAVDPNGDGPIDFIRIQMVVDVKTSGTYTVSAELVDSTLYGLPATGQIVDHLLGRGGLDARRMEVNGDGKVDVGDLIQNVNAGR